MTRKPQAFVLDSGKDEPKLKTAGTRTRIAFEPEPPQQELAVVPPSSASPRPRGMGWGALLISALMALVSLWAGLAITRLVEDFFARSPTLGWLVLAVAGLAGLATGAIIIREIWGLLRLNRIEGLQEQAARAINMDEQQSARTVEQGLLTLYGSRKDLAWPMKEFRSLSGDIIDPKDRILLADRLLMEPLDEAAHRIIARRARRVTLLTTVTPAAALDILFVASQNLGLLREIAALYGGRPSTLATFKLARMVVTHLAVTGGLALSDSLIQHLVGKGLLGRLSARFGEGAVNGILTSRIGLAAMDVCRPIPGRSPAREALGKLLREVVSFGPKDKDNEPREPQPGNTAEP
jgi:putative membrane protein